MKWLAESIVPFGNTVAPFVRLVQGQYESAAQSSVFTVPDFLTTIQISGSMLVHLFAGKLFVPSR